MMKKLTIPLICINLILLQGCASAHKKSLDLSFSTTVQYDNGACYSYVTAKNISDKQVPIKGFIHVLVFDKSGNQIGKSLAGFKSIILPGKTATANSVRFESGPRAKEICDSAASFEYVL